MFSERVDVAILGGGPGGLSAALVLGRSLRKVALIDEGKPRNQVTVKSHGFLTRDGLHPSAIRDIAHEQMKYYPNVQISKDVVQRVEKTNGLFVTKTKKGSTILSKKVIAAMGMRDHLPDIPGIKEVYGKTLFHCPYCDGWERKNEPLAVFGNGEALIPFVKIIYNWSKDLIVFTNGKAEISDEEKQELMQHKIHIKETPITAIRSSDGKMEQVILKGGEAISRKGGFMVTTGEKQASMIPALLGVPLNEKGEYETDEHGQTAIDGLFVIGDAKNTFTSLIGAASQGYEAGVRINTEFALEEWDQSGCSS
ncbi:pyridine nucleotide-disulfide oxidoreductase [Bacillus sp. FJAT-27231]|uniref:NAD(P)/FAD-dependent oxidoreductase n=1 Tax=Bacillus sp. FJAT-27231 TaxID=1679168 RepID=UPI000670A2B3|nr:NAD(P)/FAD-dependent oxidoreductase [Bacillus sp. FJAT-27231]KMY53750.1 pyridine nucleotide-disulfide oxidoreductase [Bacillus sp. FJAT-27231]